MNHRTQDGLQSLRTLAMRAGRTWAWRCATGCLAVVAVGGSVWAADPVGKESGAWSWFKPKKQQHETTNPFDARPLPKPPANSKPAPGISQPSFIVPTGGSGQLQQPQSVVSDSMELAQPKWMQPQSMVVVTDDPAGETRPADKAPQASKTAQKSTNTSRPVPQVQKTQPGVYGLLQGLAGTNVPSNTAISNASTANSQLEQSGSELARQVAGTSQAQPSSNPPVYPTTNVNQGLFPVWADATLQAEADRQAMSRTTSPSTSPVRAAVATSATTNQIQQTSATRPVNTPVATSNDPTSGLWTQMGLEPERNMVPAEPVPSGPQESAWSALMRPATLTTKSPTVPRPPTAAEAEADREKRGGKAESEFAGMDEVPDLIRPFYYTNAPPAGSGGSTGSRLARNPTEIDPMDSTLVRELMLSSDEYLRAAQDNSIQPAPPSDPSIAAAKFIQQWSSMQNPFLLTQQPQQQMFMSAAGARPGGGARQASFLQESLPEPNGTAKPDDIQLPGDDLNDADSKEGEDKDGDGKPDEKKGLAGAKKLGTAPEDNSLEFLRSQTVLLKPGKMQYDIGFEYSLTESDFPIFVLNDQGQVVVDELNFRSRELAVPLRMRYGVSKRVQAFLSVPLGWSNNQASIDGTDIFTNDGGLGDVQFGGTVQLCDANKDRPYMVGSFAALAPTGGDPFSGIIGFSPSAPSLGNGFWQLSSSVLWIETRYDPVIVFYGLGAGYSFSHRYAGIEFQPGPQYTYTFGYGFAVNERVTLSTQLFGAYQEELKANGDRLEGTNQEPISIQLAATFLNRCNRIVEPFVTFGTTDDAVSTNVGITWTY